MHHGSFPLAAALLLVATGCGQLGGVCEEECEPSANGASGGASGGGGGPAMLPPGVPPADAKPVPAGELVVGYLPTWNGALTSYATPAILSRLTHVAIAFVHIDTSGVRFERPGDVQAFVSVAHSFGVKVLMSIGGAADSDKVAEASLPGNLPTLVAQIMQCAADNQIDGIDVDIEGSAVDATYAPLVTALSAETRARNMVLSAAVGNWFEHRIEQSALDLFDFVSVMAYDECGSWTSACPHSTMELAQNQIAFWVNSRGVPAEKMVLGLPFYGYSWAGETAAIVGYGDILARVPNAWEMDWYDDGTTKLSWNGKATIASKVALGKQHGGVMIWDLASDHLDAAARDLGEHSLLRVVNESY